MAYENCKWSHWWYRQETAECFSFDINHYMHSLHEMIYFLLNKPYRYWSNGKWNGCDSVSLSDLDNLLCLLFFLFCFLICHCWFCLFSIQIFYSLLFFISFFSFDFSLLMLFVSYSDSGAPYQNGSPRFEGWAKFPYHECC